MNASTYWSALSACSQALRCGGLVGDREGVGKDWCSDLLLPKPLPFRLRLRHGDHIRSRSGQARQSGKRGFASLRAGETRIISGKRWVWGRRVYVVATRLASHGRRAKGLFRYGGDFLRRTCCDLALRSAEFDQVLQLLSPY